MKTFIYPTYDSKRDKSGNLYIDSFRKAFESDPRFKVCNTWARSETLGLLLNLRASLFILHWVDLIPSKPLGWLQTLFFRAGVLLARLRGGKIVWVLHNKEAHDDKSSKPAELMQWMSGKADYVLTHSEEGLNFFKQKYPQSKARCFYIPHPVYDSSVYPSGDRLLWDYIIWGNISRRKKVLEFVQFASQCKELDNRTIHICGRCPDPVLDQEIRNSLPANVTYENKFLTDDELKTRISSASAILFTYDGGSVLSSGALIYSLNFLKPIIGPRVGSFADMQGIVSCYDSFAEIPSIPSSQDNAPLIREYLEDNSWQKFPDKFLSQTGLSDL